MFKPFSSITQFREVIKEVTKRIRYVGDDLETGKAMYDSSVPLPIITFEGTVKLHGTNAGMGYNCVTQELCTQSRKKMITPTDDNYGFSSFVSSHKNTFLPIFEQLTEETKEDFDDITLYGEWCGGTIQPNSIGLYGLEKMFVIFDVFVSKKDSKEGIWLGCNFECLKNQDKLTNCNVFNILDFPTFKMEIDFENPTLVQNNLVDITLQVEKCCPVALAFGVEDGVGEGVVWKGTICSKVFRFKVKGHKHSSSKVKKLASVDTDKMKSIREFVDYAVTESRLNQGKNETDSDKGMFIQWILNDIIKEESDTLADNKLTTKDVAKAVKQKASQWINSFLLL